MPHLEVRRIAKKFDAFTALDQVDLAVERGEFVVLLGPSGCGKTTLLRTIAGLERQTSGQIFHAGKDISDAPPSARDYGIVFQSYALFPNLTVGENVAYGLNHRRNGREAFRQRVDEMLQLVGLPGSENKFPSQLSGGQQQRIALARALANRPDLLLLDEPLSALDALERNRLRSEIRQLQQRLGVTTIMVTHDQEEALSMADRIVVMKAGQVQQVGTPTEVYQFPANEFVADFIGRGNLLEATATSESDLLMDGLCLTSDARLRPGRLHRFNVRPEDICLLGATDMAQNSFLARVDKSEFLGGYTLVSLAPAGTSNCTLQAQFSANYLAGRLVDVGSMVRIQIPASRLVPMAAGA